MREFYYMLLCFLSIGIHVKQVFDISIPPLYNSNMVEYISTQISGKREEKKMLQLLINLLTPIFEGMGVSPTDVETYVHDLSGYIYAIFGTLLLAVVVMVAAHWYVKKGQRHLVRWGAGLAWVTVVAVLVNVICPEAAAHSEEVIRKVGEEGMVLAQNDGLLPLSDTEKLNVFGWASTNPIYGGTGSGSSSNEGNVDILTSLKDAGFEVNQEIIDMYTAYSPSRDLGGNVVSVSFTNWSLPEPPVENYTNELMENAKAFSDTALIVLSRSGGEGQDLTTCGRQKREVIPTITTMRPVIPITLKITMISPPERRICNSPKQSVT